MSFKWAKVKTFLNAKTDQMPIGFGLKQEAFGLKAMLNKHRVGFLNESFPWNCFTTKINERFH